MRLPNLGPRKGFGWPDARYLTGAGEVLLKVSAAGVNRADVMQRQGKYPPPPGASDILGLEVSGTLVMVGEGVRTLALDEHVCALLTGGGYAEYCVVPASNAFRAQWVCR
ncbi:MAG: hypothetical protein Ct9H300mP25_09350 [Acidobacteriota bacterium]|nr:MAG: hypothetical protein Ct9H300mP25_09350 [Acidobacteriota bacterium]